MGPIDDNVSVNPQTAEECVHDLRVSIDCDIHSAQNMVITLEKGNREMAIVKTKLQEAKMWAGMALAEMGCKLPEEYRDEAK